MLAVCARRNVVEAVLGVVAVFVWWSRCGRRLDHTAGVAAVVGGYAR